MPENPPTLAAPAWVTKRNGRVVPFDPEKITRSLFAATETLGQANPLLARELTDRCIEFLASKVGGDTPSTVEVADLVAKTVRDSGHVEIAARFAEGIGQRKTQSTTPMASPVFCNPVTSILNSPSPEVDPNWLPWVAGRACLREHSLREVFSRDVVAAQSDGLLTLMGMETPLELAAGVLGPLQPGERGLVESIIRTRNLIGGTIAVDGPEYALAFTSGAHDDSRDNYARELLIGLRATGLSAVVNLNSDTPPQWASEWTKSALFTEPLHPTRPEPLAEHADGVLSHLLRSGAARSVRIDWHLGSRDFAADSAGRLFSLARRAADDSRVTFVFDRPKRPIPLMEGLDRRHSCSLFAVAVHLPRLREQAGCRNSVDSFLAKLGSLARLALSAGLQKLSFLHRYRPHMTTERTFESARLIVVPVGLDAVVRELEGQSLSAGGKGLSLGQRIISCLTDALSSNGCANHLASCVDSSAEIGLAQLAETVSVDDSTTVHGLTTCEAEVDARRQIEVSGSLHAVAGGGTATVLIPRSTPLATDEVVDLLRFAWLHTEVVRLRIVRTGAPARQMTAPWERGH